MHGPALTGSASKDARERTLAANPLARVRMMRADLDQRAERQRAMRRGERAAIERAPGAD